METNTTFDYQEVLTKLTLNGKIKEQQESPSLGLKRKMFEYLEDIRQNRPCLYKEAIMEVTKRLRRKKQYSGL